MPDGWMTLLAICAHKPTVSTLSGSLQKLVDSLNMKLKCGHLPSRRIVMSLFVGNISPHVHHSELERVFRRFGQSNLELKVGYGFVVYDAVRDAEKALRALKGRIICGEQLSITWSRKQRPLRRFSDKEFPRRGYVNRDYRKEDVIKGKSFQEWEENANDMQKHASCVEEAINNDGFIRKEGRDDCLENDILVDKGKHQNLEEALLDEKCVLEPVPLENDRWGEPLSEALNERDMVEEATNLQHYGLYSTVNRSEGDACESEKCRKVKSNHSYTATNSPERVLKHWSRDDVRMERKGFGKSSEKCHPVGHVMRLFHSNAAVSRRDKFERVVSKRNGERDFRGNGFMRFKGPRETDWSKWDLSRETVLQRKDFGSERIMGHVKDRRLHHKTERFSENKWKHTRHLSDYRKEDQTRKKTARGHKQLRTDSISEPTGVRDKSHSFSLHSESQHETYSNSSESCSQSSLSRSHSSRLDSPLASSPHSRFPSSCSDLRSLRSRSVSSIPRSQAVSDRSRSVKSIPKSESPSATLRSFSVSLSPCIQKSPFLTQLGHGLCGSYDACKETLSLKNVLPSESHCFFSEQVRQKSNANAHLEGDHLRLALKIENDVHVRIIQNDVKEEQHRNTNDRGNFHPYESGGKRDIAFIYKENSHSDEATDNHNVSEGEIMNCEMSRSSALENAELPVDTIMQPVVDNSRISHVKGRDDSLLRKNNVKSVAHISLQEAKLIVNPSKGLPIEESEHESSVESYLGAACLWPWEVVHYRRLKRGAISTANYSRRMAQNEMFGIVDKYVRSSSGWWENESHEI